MVFFYSIYLFVSACGKTLTTKVKKIKSRYPLVRYDMSVGEDLLSTKEPHF